MFSTILNNPTLLRCLWLCRLTACWCTGLGLLRSFVGLAVGGGYFGGGGAVGGYAGGGIGGRPDGTDDDDDDELTLA